MWHRSRATRDASHTLMWRRTAGDTVIGTFASAYVNAGNLGLPIAAYVLGDASLIAPMLLTSLFFVHLHGHDPAMYADSALSEAGVREPPATWATRWTVIGAVWWLAAGILSSVTSRVFYGLRKEVRDARKLGQYTLVERLGEGGMGVVYRASHALLRRPTAIKLLPPDKLGEESVDVPLPLFAPARVHVEQDKIPSKKAVFEFFGQSWK